MSGLDDMIGWSGSGAVLSLFAVVPPAVDVVLTMSAAGHVPNEVRRYDMEPVDPAAGFRVLEYDAHFDAVPDRLPQYIAGCLDEALRGGASVAWFGFEGSFHFDHLLTSDVTAQIYGVADPSGIALVTEAVQLTDDGWSKRVAIARESLPWA
jgi:hypothetical protein